jgi:hypothetical protein
MTQDLWQLDKWVSCECISSPNTRSRTILINGYITESQFINCRVVFKNKQELFLFTVRYSSFFNPLVYQDDFTSDEKLIMWDYYIKISERRLYCQGP